PGRPAQVEVWLEPKLPGDDREIRVKARTGCTSCAMGRDPSMEFPRLAEDFRLARLKPPAGKVRMVLDTDTFNEIDDQFAVVYSLLSPEAMEVEAIYA